MSNIPTPDETEPKRRKVRKGTHSCWECRRRKIRCQFASDDDVVCVGCQSRGCDCLSQDVEDQPMIPRRRRKVQRTEPQVTQRLGRLEELMGRLVEKSNPSPQPETSRHVDTATETTAAALDEELRNVGSSKDILGISLAKTTPVAMILGIDETMYRASCTSRTTESNQASHSCDRTADPDYAHISKRLHALFPSQEVIDTLVFNSGSYGAQLAVSLFFSSHEINSGRGEPASTVAIIPPASSHPALLAKRLLQIAICMQPVPPETRQKLGLSEPLISIVQRIARTVSKLVTSDDDLVGSIEGLQSLVLLGLVQQNLGNVRKAWLCNRRALSLGQLMGLECGYTQAFKSCDPTLDPRWTPSMAMLWYRINYYDRHMSLFIGLRVGSSSVFDDEEAMRTCTAKEKFERQLLTFTSRVIDRNQNRAGQAYTLTQSIDYDLEAAATALDRDWWDEGIPNRTTTPFEMVARVSNLMVQLQHFVLLVLLHLPYMLRDQSESRHDYSKATCMRASREVLRRFLVYRQLARSSYACRHVDYAALIGAMSLLLGYLGQRPTSRNPEAIFEAQRQRDKALAEQAKERMEHIAVLNNDKLSQESAEVIAKLLPLIDLASAAGQPTPTTSETNSSHHSMHLNVPYVGTVNIDRDHMVSSSGFLTTLSPCHSGPGARAGSRDASRVWHPEMPLSDNLDLGRSQDDLRGYGGYGENGADLGFANIDAGGLMFPGTTADGQDWTFQGVDTTFWNLLNGKGIA